MPAFYSNNVLDGDVTLILSVPDFLACPIDGLNLSFDKTGSNPQVNCSNGHCFDLARQGYINLLGVQDKRSKDPGDSKAMIVARSRILNAGLYATIAEKLSEIINEFITSIDFIDSQKSGVKSRQVFQVLDAGCGDGYYLQHCIDRNKSLIEMKGIGLDISKWAIQAAAKRQSGITWLVGSNRNPPLLANSVDMIICAFGFPDYLAFKKILKASGCVLLLDPGSEHLLELRKIIYPFIKPYKGKDLSKAIEAGFKLMSVDKLASSIKVSQQQINDILTMSPHLYKASSEGKEKVNAIVELILTLDVNFTLLQL